MSLSPGPEEDVKARPGRTEMVNQRPGMTPDLRSLTSLRFFAAFGVLGYHGALYLPPFPGFEVLTSLGYTGVTFFFVLSGFVLTWSWRTGDRPLNFYARRFARVWPLHFVMTMVVVGIFALTNQPQDPVGLASVLTLTQAWLPPSGLHYAYNGPSWTLSCEAFFYAVFPFLVIFLAKTNLRRSTASLLFLMSAGLTIILVGASLVAPSLGVTPRQLSGYLSYVFPGYRVGEFAVGILVGLAVRAGWRTRLGIKTSVAICFAVYAVMSGIAWAIFAGEIQELPYGLADLGMMVPFAALIAAASSADLRGHKSTLRCSVMVALGKGSFALYLVHEQLFRLAARVPAAGPAAGAIRLLLCTALALGVAQLAHHFIEAPAERYLRRRLTRAPSPRPKPVQREPGVVVTSEEQ